MIYLKESHDFNILSDGITAKLLLTAYVLGTYHVNKTLNPAIVPSIIY